MWVGIMCVCEVDRVCGQGFRKRENVDYMWEAMSSKVAAFVGL